MQAARGRVPEDAENFSFEAVQKLRKACRHVCYLLNEGYSLKAACTFVGNHFLLSERQRLAVMRSVASEAQRMLRAKKCVPPSDLRDKTVWIDDFNEIITLEVLLCQSPLFRCMDGAIRDLASLRGTYRLIPETFGAISLLLSALRKTGVQRAVLLLDAPVSNSGRLKSAIAAVAEAETCPVQLDIRVQKDVDRELYDCRHVITSDSVILDHCRSWVNLTELCLKASTPVLQIW